MALAKLGHKIYDTRSVLQWGHVACLHLSRIHWIHWIHWSFSGHFAKASAWIQAAEQLRNGNHSLLEEMISTLEDLGYSVSWNFYFAKYIYIYIYITLPGSDFGSDPGSGHDLPKHTGSTQPSLGHAMETVWLLGQVTMLHQLRFFFQRWPEIARSRLLGIERILLFSTLEGTETQATLPQWTSPWTSLLHRWLKDDRRPRSSWL